MKRCNVCGKLFVLSAEDVYQVKESASILAAFTAPGTIYDAVDCPKCGCQNLLKIRMPAVDIPLKEGDED